MIDKIFEQQYEISLFFVNSQKNLGIYQLLNILQDVAFRHSASTNYSGKQDKKYYWVLVKQALQAEYWPKLGDKIAVRTWLAIDKRGFLLREYALFLNKDKICTSSTSVAKLDSITKKIVSIENDEIKSYTKNQQLSYTPYKIAPFTKSDILKTFLVRNSDIDFNQHVNNTIYCKWLLDAISYEEHFKFNLLAYDINFLAESYLGDEIQIQRQIDDPRFFQGLRISDKKIVFTAKVEVEPKKL